MTRTPSPRRLPSWAFRDRTKQRWVYVAFSAFLLPQVAAGYEDGGSNSAVASLQSLEANLVKLKEESLQIRSASEVLHRKASGAAGTGGANLVEGRSSEAALSAQNDRLRAQLQSSLASQGAAPADGTQRRSQGLSLLAVPRERASQMIYLVLAFVLVNTVVFLTLRASDSQKPALEKARARLGEPLMRAIGRGCYEIEISEIQVANLFMPGEVYLSVHVGDSQEASAHAAAANGLVRFQDRLRFRLRAKDSDACVFRLLAAGDRLQAPLAELRLTSQDVLRRVRSKHGQQYFSFRMSMEDRQSAGRLSGPGLQLALRMRELQPGKAAAMRPSPRASHHA